MDAQPKPRSGVASLARQDLPSRAAAMLTCAVCSLLRASCLFSCFSSLFSLSLFRPAPLHAVETGLKSAILRLRRVLPQSVPSLSAQLLHNSLCDFVRDNAVILDRLFWFDAR